MGAANPAFGCDSTSRGRTSLIALRKMYLVVGRKNPLSLSLGGKFQATNSASSRSRNGTRTSTDEAILILSLYVRFKLAIKILVSRYNIWFRKSDPSTCAKLAR